MSWQNAPVLGKLTASQRGGDRGAQLWGVDVRGKLYTIYQKSPGGEWSNWMGPEWAPINHPKYVYELAACQLADGRVSLWVLDAKREIWHVDEESPGGNWGHWWHSTSFKGRWNNAPGYFKRICATHTVKSQGSLADTPGGAMFIGVKEEEGFLAVCFNTGTSWSRFRDVWNNASHVIEATACQQADGRTAIWVLNDKRELWASFEGEAGKFDFSGWIGPNWKNSPRLRNIAAIKGSAGAILVGQDEHYRVVTNSQTAAGDNWSGWSQPNWANAPPSFELTAAGQNNGKAQIWAITLQQKLTSITQLDGNRWPDRWSDYDEP
jgi:hypothetical protein